MPGKTKRASGKLGLIGLGRMGASMARRLANGGVRVYLYDKDAKLTKSLARKLGAVAATSPADLVNKLTAPRTIWLMLPAGEATARVIDSLDLAKGDLLVDGGNAHYRDSQARAAKLAARGVDFIDAGVSGGVHGLASGYCLMLGGTKKAVARIGKITRRLAATPQATLHCGPPGAGHFVKMIHNGIEYGMMQAYAEGFAIMRGKQEFSLDVAKIAELWRNGSVVRSWLLDLAAEFLREDASLADVAPQVADSGEGRWTVIEAVEQGLPAPAASLALMMRFASQGRNDYSAKLLAKLREGFGGHRVARVKRTGKTGHRQGR